MSTRDLAPRTPGDEHLPPCCEGSVYDPGGCTCWIDIYDRPQLPVVAVEMMEVRVGRCHDCATRADSPERAEAEGREDQWVELRMNARRGWPPFFCHVGSDGTPMRRRVAERHPDGREVKVDGDDYDPPASQVKGCPVFHLADGRAAPICAGWARIARTHGHDWFDRGELPVRRE